MKSGSRDLPAGKAPEPDYPTRGSIMGWLGENEMNVSGDSTVLSSWKDIARYLGKGVRTVQRWERHLGLPVRRPIGASQKSAVVLYRGDVDAWLATRFSARSFQKDGEEGNVCSRSARSTLKEGIEKARELRTANQKLTEQIMASVRLLSERCDLLSTQGLQEPWRSAEPVEWERTTVPDLLTAPRSASSTVGSERIA
jgi:hypothetical protein